MPEPTSAPVRPNRMRGLAAVAALIVLAGCGSDQQQGREPAGRQGGASSSGSSTVGSCRADSAQVTEARQLATADLDGDGTPEAVKLTGAGGECPDMLFARVGEDLVSTSLADDGPAATRGFAITVPGQKGQLIVTRADHARGGFQLRVYAATADRLAELTVDGNPLVPFVALDVLEHPLSVDCAGGGLVLTDAVLHEPIGDVPGWDVTRTSYAVNGSSVTVGETRKVADNVPTKQLRATYPELLDYAAFESCRAG